MKEYVLYHKETKTIVRLTWEELMEATNNKASELQIRRILKRFEEEGSIKILKQVVNR